MQLDTDEFEHDGRDMYAIEHSDMLDWWIAIEAEHTMEIRP